MDPIGLESVPAETDQGPRYVSDPLGGLIQGLVNAVECNSADGTAGQEPRRLAPEQRSAVDPYGNLIRGLINVYENTMPQGVNPQPRVPAPRPAADDVFVEPVSSRPTAIEDADGTP